MHWIMHVFGLDSGTGPAYLFFSGSGSDFGELLLVGGLLSIYRRHNCHVRRCFRIGRYPVEGTPYITCRRHHPVIDKAPSPEDLHG